MSDMPAYRQLKGKSVITTCPLRGGRRFADTIAHFVDGVSDRPGAAVGLIAALRAALPALLSGFLDPTQAVVSLASAFQRSEVAAVGPQAIRLGFLPRGMDAVRVAALPRLLVSAVLNSRRPRHF